MIDNDAKRLSRLTAILTQLQSNKLVTAPALAKKYRVSVRTIYRDIRALEQAGIPVLTEEGKGYYLMDGYRLPPVSFTESEAKAMITAEQLLAGNRDSSLVKEFSSAVQKIKAVLRQEAKDHVERLAERMIVSQTSSVDTGPSYLVSLQHALTHYFVIKMEYRKEGADAATERLAEPFALLTTQGNWLLLAWCRLRKEFRVFRLDRIEKMNVLNENFRPHPMTLAEYFAQSQKKD